MARDTDRKQISEAIRFQTLWRREVFGTHGHLGGTYVEYVTDLTSACTSAMGSLARSSTRSTRMGQLRRDQAGHDRGTSLTRRASAACT